MDQKKKTPETIPCPLPGHNSALELKEQDGRIIGICRCDVPQNQWAGQPVYEGTSDKGVDNG